MAIHSPPIWTEQCTLQIYQTNEASGGKGSWEFELYNMLLMANSQDRARDYFQCAVYFLTVLGFVLNVDKSVSSPGQQIEFLKFILESSMMTISLTLQKLSSLLRLTRHLAEETQTTLREISQVPETRILGHVLME